MATSSSLAVTSSTSTGSSAVPALMTRSTEVLYRFLVPEYVTQFGEYLKVVGSLPQLGSWDLGAAPAMTWQPGHKWLFEVRLPRTTYEFKVVAMQGSGVRWEQGINRVVQADQGEMDVPVELVINLHCEFGLTTATGMELVLNRKSVQETYELAAATLELLQKRRERLEQQLKKAGKSRKPSTEQQAEAARLDAALTAQQRSLSDLSNLVSTAKLSEDGEALLLTMEGGKVQLPDPIGLLSNAQAASVTMALGEPPLPEVLPQLEDGVHTSTDKGPAATNGAPAAAADAASSNGNGYVAAQQLQQQQEQQQQEAELGSVDGASPAEAASRNGDGWGTEDMGDPAVEAYLQGDASAHPSLESDYELEPDDAAAAMAAAAFANLPTSKQTRKRRASGSSGAKQSKNGAVDGAAAPAPASAPAPPAPAPAATAAAAPAATALSAAEVLSGEAAAPEATHAAPAEAAPDAEDAEATPAAVAEAVAAAADAVAAAEQPQNAVNTLAAAAQAVAAAEEAGEAAEALAADNNMEAALEAQTAAEVAAYAAAVAAATAAEAAGVIVEIPAPPAAVAAAAPAQQAPAAEPATPAEAPAAAAPATEAAAVVSPTAISEQEPEPRPGPSPGPGTPVIDPMAPLGARSGPGTTAAAVAAAKEALAAAIAAAAAANATVAAALEEESERGTKRASALAHLLGDVDLEKLPAPKPVAGGAVLFTADMLASVQLVKDPKPPKPRRRGTPRPRVEAVP